MGSEKKISTFLSLFPITTHTTHLLFYLCGEKQKIYRRRQEKMEKKVVVM